MAGNSFIFIIKNNAHIVRCPEAVEGILIQEVSIMAATWCR